MKCNYALKKVFSERISVKLKQNIDDHISGCSYCQKQRVLSENTGKLLNDHKDGWNFLGDKLSLLRAVRQFREKREQKWWLRLSDKMPLEPANRRTLFAGATFAAALAIYFAFAVPGFENTEQLADDTFEDTDFYIQEHALTQDTDLFGQGSYSQVFLSLASANTKFKYPNNKN